MTVSTPNTLKTTLFQDGQSAGSITPAYIRTLVDSESGIAAAAQTSSYQLVLADAGTCIEMNSASANNLTVPANATVAFDVGTVIEVYNMGAGQTTVVAAGSVTIRSSTGTLTLRAQYSIASLRKRATDEWVISGDLT